MLFQLRTDNHIENSEDLAASVQGEVLDALEPRYGDRLRRVEVYLQDMNGQKGGIDKRCAIEAHLAGLAPIAVDDRATNADQAVTGAVDKLLRALEHKLGRIEDRAGHKSASGAEG
jgi:hypothetical protein